MLIAIISDLHDNLFNLKKFLAWSKQNKVKKIICCGDVGNAKTLKFLATNFSGDIFLVAGNAETFEVKNIIKYPNIKFYQETGVVNLAGLYLGFCHQVYKAKKIIKESDNKLNFIFYGHSHKPWLEKTKDIILANPGNLADILYPASFAILNAKNKKLELKILSHL